MAATRFLVAGAVLFALSVGHGDRTNDPIGWRQWRAALVVGAAFFVLGQGSVVIGSLYLPSGLTALLASTPRLWVAVIGRIFLRRRLNWKILLGLLAGFGRLVILVAPGRGSGTVSLPAAGVLTAGAISWAAGSLYAGNAGLAKRPLVAAAMQLLAGGALIGVAGMAHGELHQLRLSQVSAASAAALAYAAMVPSLIGFSTFIWLLQATTPDIANTTAP